MVSIILLRVAYTRQKSQCFNTAFKFFTLINKISHVLDLFIYNRINEIWPVISLEEREKKKETHLNTNSRIQKKKRANE